MMLAFTASAFSQNKAEPHPFFDKTNVALFTADALVRSLDAESTRANLTNPCGCFVEENIPAIAARTSTAYAYSLGVSAGIVGLSYLAHRRGFHKIERLLPLIDIVYDGSDVIHNYTQQPHSPSNVQTHLTNHRIN